jgi:hypothetical protein
MPGTKQSLQHRSAGHKIFKLLLDCKDQLALISISSDPREKLKWIAHCSYKSGERSNPGKLKGL